MAGNRLNGRIDALFRRGQWQGARALLERELEKEPDNHWVLTQIGVTFYEQRRYKDARKLFLASQKIVPDCPLTLWNLAGALDSLGNHAGAIRIYTWLLQSDKSPEEDPCWESREWSDALKGDCVYRLGACFQHLGKKRKADHCFHQYVNLLSMGIDASYSIDDVKRQVRALHGLAKNGAASEIRKSIDSTLQLFGIEPRKARRGTPPKLKIGKLVMGRRVPASKSTSHR